MSARGHDAIVIGAGVGGAALALALARAGLRVLLVERRSGPGNINRGDSLLPAVTRLLAAWGALDRVRAAGAAPVEKMRVHHPTRGLLMEAPLGDPAGHPYLVLPHPEIERALTEEARATGRVDVRYCTRLIGLVESDGRVIGVDLVDREGKSARETARLVIGADGSSSQVREALGIELALAPYPAGYFIIDFERPRDFEEAMNLYHPSRRRRDGRAAAAGRGRDRGAGARAGERSVSRRVAGRQGGRDPRALSRCSRRPRRCRGTRTSMRCRAGTRPATSRAAPR